MRHRQTVPRIGISLLTIVLVTCTAFIGLPTGARSVTAPPGFVVENAFPGVSFVGPVQAAFLPDGRTLVAEQRGYVWTVTENGVKLPSPFIDLRLEVALDHDVGLLSIAIDPDFTLNRWVYLGYTVDPNGDGLDDDEDRFCRVSRYQAAVADPNVADLSTREDLLGATWPEGIPTLHFSHTIGTLRFAADKTLLISAGDGGHFSQADNGGLDPDAFGPGKTDPAEDIGAFRARSLNSLAGKILRIDKDTGFGLESNPYWDGDPLSDESRIWAYGLRNPYRFSIRPGTGSPLREAGQPGVLYVGDVGWSSFEEFDVIREGGLNHGWPCYEGAGEQSSYQLFQTTEAGNDSILCSSALNLENPAPETPPVFWWHQTDGNLSNPQGWVGASAIGGDFYTGNTYPVEYQGRYFLADYVGGWIRSIEVDADDNIVGWSDFIENAFGPVDVSADPVSGDLFYISIWDGEVRRIRYTVPAAVDEPTGAESPSDRHLVAASRPNPFHRTTSIEFDLREPGSVTLRVYDPQGRVVRSILNESGLAAGHHSIEWDGRDDSGIRRTAGVYFCRMRIGDQVRAQKIVLE